jgi:hypothetical protein
LRVEARADKGRATRKIAQVLMVRLRNVDAEIGGQDDREVQRVDRVEIESVAEIDVRVQVRLIDIGRDAARPDDGHLRRIKVISQQVPDEVFCETVWQAPVKCASDP